MQEERVPLQSGLGRGMGRVMVSRGGVRTSGGALPEPEPSNNNLSEPLTEKAVPDTSSACWCLDSLCTSAMWTMCGPEGSPHHMLKPPADNTPAAGLHSKRLYLPRSYNATPAWPNQTSLLSPLRRCEALPSLSFPEYSPSALGGHTEVLHFLYLLIHSLTILYSKLPPV